MSNTSDEIPVILGCMVRKFISPRYPGIKFEYAERTQKRHWPIVDILATINGQRKVAFRFKLELDCSNDRAFKKELIIGRETLYDLQLAARDFRILFSSLGFDVREGNLE